MSFSEGYCAASSGAGLYSRLLIGNTTGSCSPALLRKITHEPTFARGQLDETARMHIVKGSPPD